MTCDADGMRLALLTAAIHRLLSEGQRELSASLRADVRLVRREQGVIAIVTDGDADYVISIKKGWIP